MRSQALLRSLMTKWGLGMAMWNCWCGRNTPTHIELWNSAMGQAGLLLLHHATFGIRKNQKPVIITRFCKNQKTINGNMFRCLTNRSHGTWKLLEFLWPTSWTAGTCAAASNNQNVGCSTAFTNPKPSLNSVSKVDKSQNFAALLPDPTGPGLRYSLALARVRQAESSRLAN